MGKLQQLSRAAQGTVRLRWKNSAPEAVLIAALVVIAVLIRWAGHSFYTYDMGVFHQWSNELLAHGRFHGLKYEIGNYNAPFLYLLSLSTLLPFSMISDIKLVFVLFDALLVYYTYRTVALRFQGWRVPTLAALVMAFLPTVVVDASFYGQCDSMFGAFGVAAVYYLLRDKPWWACSMFAVSFAFKPQAVYVMPVLVLLLLTRRVPWRALLAMPLVYIALDIPALIAGRDPIELLTIYTRQTAFTPELTLNAPSVFQFIPATTGTELIRQMGILFTGALVLLLCYVMIASRAQLTADRLVLFCALLGVGVPFFLPGSHERYLFLGDVLTVIVVCYRPRLWPVPLLVQAGSLLSYIPYLFFTGTKPTGHVSLQLLAACMLAAIILMGYDLLRDLAAERRDAAAQVTDAEPARVPAQRTEGPATIESPASDRILEPPPAAIIEA